ncbi:MAG: hypothetical protein OK422_04445 [Thaumarchaeota archaeon]|nr:hypothetical protein [Nitrososphaerota archaeon]
MSLTIGVSVYALLRAIAWARLSSAALRYEVSPADKTVPKLHCFFDEKVEEEVKKSGWPHKKLLSSERGTFLVPVAGSLILGGVIDLCIVLKRASPATFAATLRGFLLGELLAAIGAVLLLWGIYEVYKKSKDAGKPCCGQAKLPN